MTIRRIILRGLCYHWRTNLCAAAGLAIATAVIVGSLMVGDSMSGSLRRMALANIGSIDAALATPGFFRAELANDLRRVSDQGERLPVTQTSRPDEVLSTGETPVSRGSVSTDLKSELSAAAESKHLSKPISAAIVIAGLARQADADSGNARVTICGVDDVFWSMFPGAPRSVVADRIVAINQTLADDLNVKIGDEILLKLERPSRVARSSLFADRKRDKTIRAIRVEVGQILPARGVGGFNLQAGAAAVRNVFISRDFFARSLDKSGLANLLLVAATDHSNPPDHAALQSAVNQSAALRDYGLRVVKNETGNCLSLESDSILLTPQQLDAAKVAADSLSATTSQASVYLATRIAPTNNQAPGVSYSIVAAIDAPSATSTPPFTFLAGGSAEVGDDGIWLNEWAAQDANVKVGDEIDLTTLAAGADGSYREIPMRLKLTGILAMTGSAIDASFTPSLAGLTDAARIDRWDVPFPVDHKRVTDRDEQYWDRYRATPKAFLSMGTMQQIWSSASSMPPPFVTSLRITVPQNIDRDDFAARLETTIARQLPASGAQFTLRPVRDELLASSRGSTDFGSLLLAMGFFLIATAVGLAGTLMRLSLSRRAGELGMMLACGWSPRKASLTFLIEGALLAIVGMGLGLPLGVMYCQLVLVGLSRAASGVWNGPSLQLDLTGATLVIGALAGLIVGLLCALWGLRALRGRPVLMLLAGWQRMELRAVSNRWTKLTLLFMLIVGIGLPALSIWGAILSATLAFFISGTCLLIAGILAARLMMSNRIGGIGCMTLGAALLPPRPVHRERVEVRVLLQTPRPSPYLSRSTGRGENARNQADLKCHAPAGTPGLQEHFSDQSEDVVVTRASRPCEVLNSGEAMGTGKMPVSHSAVFTDASTALSLPRLAIRNASSNRARSLLVVGLLAGASFILVAVAANRREVPEATRANRAGGAGGFALRATTTLPLRFDLSSAIGQKNLGFTSADQQLLADATIIPFLSVAGDDISCRSLTTPIRPRLIGAPQAMIERGGFSVQLMKGLTEANPWNALLPDEPDGAIPVFGDADSIQWILKSNLSEVLNVTGPNDKPLRLHIVGAIPGSIFAGELIMSAQHLRQLHGDTAGQSYFLIDSPPAKQDQIVRVLRRSLDDFGIEVESARQIIEGFLAVQNLYLSMFLMLGGLGMLLGAGGMLAVILRNVMERKRELGLMQACGFSGGRLLMVIAMEHAGLLLAGLLCGTLAALLAVAPTLASSQCNVNWLGLATLLIAIALVGMIGCLIGAALSIRGNLLAALRQE